MGFINYTETIIRKHNGDIVNFYIKNNNLFLRTFNYDNRSNDTRRIMENIVDNQIDIKIDQEDRIYGIANVENKEVIYLYTNKDKDIAWRKLFDYDSQRYILRFPYIKKINSNLHILYYLQDRKDSRIWSIFNHYFDGEAWVQNTVDFIVSFPIINPFFINCNTDKITIFYFNKVQGVEEVFFSRFDAVNKSWSKPSQITDTGNKKIYLNILQEEIGFCHITWSEFVHNNLEVKYMNCSLKEDAFSKLNVVSLSERSNCSFPTLIKTGETLWDIWVQMNKLYNCHSFDLGKTWSPSTIDTESYNVDFIRYKFISNNEADLNQFKLYNTFGTSYPDIKFIGFKNLRTI